MACVPRSPARVRLPVLIAAAGLTGCGAPISNQVFLEEALFLGALPTQLRFGAPSAVLLAPKSDAAVLGSAKQAASDWDDLFGLLIAAGDQLQHTAPDEASDVLRRWDGVDVAARIAGSALGLPAGVVTFAVSCEIVRPDDGDVSWELSFASTTDGPWTTALTGAHRTLDTIPQGEIDWDVTATMTALGTQPAAPLGIVAASYVDTNPEADWLRTVEATRTLLPGLVESFAAVGEETFGYAGDFAITDDGATWPGGGAVYHGGVGGWGEGVVVVNDVPLTFEACWDVNGTPLYQSGDPGVVALGDRVACTVADPF